MPVERKVNAEAADPKHGMTLDELAAFVQEAKSAEVSGETVVKVTVNLRSGIKKTEVTG
jgi:hypothetical protein